MLARVISIGLMLIGAFIMAGALLSTETPNTVPTLLTSFIFMLVGLWAWGLRK